MSITKQARDAARRPAYAKAGFAYRDEGFDDGNNGIDVLHYFAARAPGKPAKWYQPEPQDPRMDGDEYERYRSITWPFAWAEAVLGVDSDIREQLARYRTIVRLLFEFNGKETSMRSVVLDAATAAAADYSDNSFVTLDKCEQAVAIAAAMAVLNRFKGASVVTDSDVEQWINELAGAVNADRAATLGEGAQ